MWSVPRGKIVQDLVRSIIDLGIFEQELEHDTVRMDSSEGPKIGAIVGRRARLEGRKSDLQALLRFCNAVLGEETPSIF